MRLTPRRRALLAILPLVPLGYFYLGWTGHLVFQLFSQFRNHFTNCSGSGFISLVDRWNGCQTQSFSITSAVIELAVLAAVLVLVGYGVARWITWPIQAMAESIGQLGPTSLAARMRPVGPRDETRRLADAIDALLDRVADGYQAQRRFAANASHELRTPLATQRALIEVSLGSDLTPDQLELLTRQLLATNERNEQLIDGLLVLAETDQGLLTRNRIRLDLVAAAMVENLQPAARRQRLRLDTQLSPLTVRGELPLLERLLTNLTQNALKYNQPDGWATVEVSGDGMLRVSNSGPPVPPESVPGLFEPFRRGSGDRLDHTGGAGLGLTIVRSIVAAHGGTVSATAPAAGGLSVRVQLPSSNRDSRREL
ncbi:MAG: ATP-binding protein [Actinomycetota bacterium]|nr:ATP-binding protein [Actinomycetota bacterium]MDQ2958853.1 ATP-binding protein [Actinomycetota bacterium]